MFLRKTGQTRSLLAGLVKLATMRNRLWLPLVSLLLIGGVSFTCSAPLAFLDPLKHDIMVVSTRTHSQLVLNYSNRNGVTTLLHYSTDSPKDRDFINNIFNKASLLTQGMVRFAAINCAENQQFCKENLNPDLTTPFVVLYPPSPIPPQVVQKAYINDPKKLANLALNQIVSERIATLTSANQINSFITASPGIPKLLFFSTKETAPTLLKAVSNHFADRIETALVPASVPDSVRKTVKARSPPSCVLVRNTDKGPSKMESYTGDFTFSALREWVNIHAETFVKGGGFHEGAASEAAPIARPWLKEKIPELMGVSHQDICFREKHVCAIFISNGPLSTEHRAMLERVVQRHETEQRAGRGVSLKWSWLDGSIEKPFLPFFGITTNSKDGVPAFLILKTKQLRYAKAKFDAKDLESGVEDLVERVSSGDARFIKVNGSKIPAFAGRAEEPNGSSGAEGRANEL